MKRILIVSFITLVIFDLALAQKRMTILGDAWTGEVVSTNDSTREITIKYDTKGKTETFTGVLVESYKVKMKDGSIHDLKVSEIPVGTQIRVFFKSKEQDVGGRAVKINRISRIDFLGKDEFSGLREALNLDPSFPVTLIKSGSLPTAKSLKMYFISEDDRIKNRFIDWVSKWNQEQGVKYGSLEFVSNPAEADVALVVFRGFEQMVVDTGPSIVGADGRLHNLFPITAFLASRKSNGLEVIWKKNLFTTHEAQADNGQIETEIEKRMKARSKK